MKTKIKIDTSEEQWEQYVQEIIAFLGLGYGNIDSFRCDVKQYLGTYRLENGTAEWTINYDKINRSLFTSLFWPYMPMRCLADNVFELISFPVELHFQKDEDRMQFIVRGNYDWEFNDQLFIRV